METFLRWFVTTGEAMLHPSRRALKRLIPANLISFFEQAEIEHQCITLHLHRDHHIVRHMLTESFQFSVLPHRDRGDYYTELRTRPLRCSCARGSLVLDN